MTRIPQLRRNERPRPKNRQYWPWVFVGIIVVLGVVGALSQGQISRAVNQPLGPTLPPFASTASTPVIAPIPGGLAEVVATPTPPGPIANLISAPQLPNANIQCSGPGQMVILLIGADNESGYSRGLADAIRLVKFDFAGGSISTLALPRDLWVKIPDLNHNAEVDLHNLLGEMLDEHGNPMYPPGDYGKLNVPYFYGDLYDYPGRGPGLLAKTILLNLGITVDHYVVINMGIFPELIDAVDGVDINVPKEINDTEKGWFFKKGLQHMDGETALHYARTRITDTDWARMGRQDQVIMAYRDRVLQPEVWPKIPAVIDTALNNISTDLTRGDITAMTCLVGKIPREQVRNYLIGGDMVTVAHTSTGSYVMLPQPIPIGKMVYQFLYGLNY